MPVSVCERFDLKTSTWASFTIKNGPNISSFGWCPSLDKGCIFVLGGSDGLILTSELYKIDFNKGEAEYILNFESNVAFSRLVSVLRYG